MNHKQKIVLFRRAAFFRAIRKKMMQFTSRAKKCKYDQTATTRQSLKYDFVPRVNFNRSMFMLCLLYCVPGERSRLVPTRFPPLVLTRNSRNSPAHKVITLPCYFNCLRRWKKDDGSCSCAYVETIRVRWKRF